GKAVDVQPLLRGLTVLPRRVSDQGAILPGEDPQVGRLRDGKDMLHPAREGIDPRQERLPSGAGQAMNQGSDFHGTIPPSVSQAAAAASSTALARFIQRE